MPRSDSPIDLSAIATVETHGVPIVAVYDDDKEKFFVLKDRTGEMSAGRGLTTEFFGEELGDAVVEWEVKDDPPRKYNLLKVLVVTENPAHARWQEERDIERTKKAEKKAKKEKKVKKGKEIVQAAIPCDPRCPSEICGGRADRCGLYAFPKLCQIGPGGCTQAGAGMQGEDTLPAPEEWSEKEEIEQSFITELRAGTARIEGRRVVILRCDEESTFPNFRIFIRTANAFETHDFNVHNIFFGGPQQKVDLGVMTAKHERAKKYAEGLGALFDIEVRDETGFE